MSSYQYRKSHCGDKTVVRSSYLHNGISYTGKMSSLYIESGPWLLMMSYLCLNCPVDRALCTLIALFGETPLVTCHIRVLNCLLVRDLSTSVSGPLWGRATGHIALPHIYICDIYITSGYDLLKLSLFTSAIRDNFDFGN